MKYEWGVVGLTYNAQCERRISVDASGIQSLKKKMKNLLQRFAAKNAGTSSV